MTVDEQTEVIGELRHIRDSGQFHLTLQERAILDDCIDGLEGEEPEPEF